jgi:hypothetical protein
LLIDGFGGVPPAPTFNEEKNMTKSEWISRCAAQYVKRAGLTQEQASEAALACLEGLEVQDDDEIAADPEDYADDDMSYWTHDE